jgi:hypothetical protein
MAVSQEKTNRTLFDQNVLFLQYFVNNFGQFLGV